VSPLAYGALAGLISFCAGFWIDHQIMQAKITENENQALRAKQDFMAHYLDAKKAADADKQAIEQRANTALEKARNAKQAPISCPPGVDVFDIVIPGLGDELRLIQGGDIHDPGPDMGKVQINPNSL
jgi:hypothetical protein